MNSVSTQEQQLIIPNRLFGSFQRLVRYKTDRNIEVMGIVFGKEYRNGEKVNRLIVPDQAGTATT